MRAMSNLEYAAVVRELQPLLGRRFERLSRLKEGTYRLKLGDAEIAAELGLRLHRTKYVEEAEAPDKLCQKAKAELDNSKLESISQINNDRIVEFRFSHGSLVFEMFAKGNAVLIKDGKILASAKEEKWAGREIRRGSQYKPPEPGFASNFRDALSEKYVIASMMKLPLGKEYAQDILARCKVPEKTPGLELTGRQIECIEDGIKEAESAKEPHVFYGKGGKPADFGLMHFSRYKDSDLREFATLNEALDEYYWNAERETLNPELEKLEHRLAEQEKRLAELEKEEKAFKEQGDFIYANYQKIEAILKEAKASAPEELEKKLSKLKPKLDRKEKTVEIEIG